MKPIQFKLGSQFKLFPKTKYLIVLKQSKFVILQNRVLSLSVKRVLCSVVSASLRPHGL